MARSPVQMSLGLLRLHGFTVDVTEHWNSFAKRRQDLFGFADLLAIRGSVTGAVQCTTGSNVAARVRKIRSLPAARAWLEGGTRRIEVHGWVKRGPRGKRKTWQLKRVEVTL
jgi:hypothetical protein